MRFLNQLAFGETGLFEWRSISLLSRTFSLSDAPVLVRGRIFSSELIYSAAYPARCELSTARPFAGATVVIATLAGRRVARTVTDERGIFRVRLKPGMYIITAPKLDISRRISVERGETRSFDIVSIG